MGMDSIVYRYKDGLYVNFTNQCPTACAFCIKFSWKMRYRSYDLRLSRGEPAVFDVLAAAEKAYAEQPFSELVFCGYGESTYRLADMIEACRRIREKLPAVRRRLNTVGLGNLVCGRPIASELRGSLEAVCVSLNTADPAQWVEIMRPKPEFLERGFSSVKDFIRECAAQVTETAATAVERPDVDLKACGRLAESLGARFRLRPHLDGYEEK